MIRTLAVIGTSLGALVAAAVVAQPPLPAPHGDPVRGKVVFARCAACHAIGGGGGGGFGPNLAGVYGRAAGTLPGYQYSAAMKKSGLRWNEATLNRFLTSPMRTVPGTKMAYPGISDPTDRANVIAYLAASSRK